MKGNKTQKGITMVALIITIIVLLILAVVAVSSITDENGGLIAKVEQAVSRWEQAGLDENTQLQNYYNYINSINLGTTVDPETGACLVHVLENGACKNCGTTFTLGDGGCDSGWNGTGCSTEDVDFVEYDTEKFGEPGVVHERTLYCGTCYKEVENTGGGASCSDSNSDGKCDECEATMPEPCTHSSYTSENSVHSSAICNDCGEHCSQYTSEDEINFFNAGYWANKDCTTSIDEYWAEASGAVGEQHRCIETCNVCGYQCAEYEVSCTDSNNDGKCDGCKATMKGACTHANGYENAMHQYATCVDCGEKCSQYTSQDDNNTGNISYWASKEGFARSVEPWYYWYQDNQFTGIVHRVNYTCDECGQLATQDPEEDCYDNDNDGKCDACGETKHVHNYVDGQCSSCGMYNY